MAPSHQLPIILRISGEKPLNRQFRKTSEKLLVALSLGSTLMRLTVKRMKMENLKSSSLRLK
jgi:hypothetical protein